jgi:SAM-dependent methyltransferase
LRARIRTAWRRSAADRDATRERLLDALDHDLPTDRWLDFGGDTASARDIEARIASTRRSLLVERRTTRYLLHRRDWYDGRIATDANAMALSYPGPYARGLAQAPVQQAHVLIDYLRRTYRVNRQASVSDVLTTAFQTPQQIRVLDFGCGVGRSMEVLADAGIRVDGMDISERMIAVARQNPKLAASKFFVTRGNDCGDAPESAYDLVYSQLCLQHICSRTIRNQILHALSRALRPGGVIVAQMQFHPDRTFRSVPAPHVPWSADPVVAARRGRFGDVWPTPDELSLIYSDFSQYFADVALQTIDLRPTDQNRRPGELVVSATQKSGHNAGSTSSANASTVVSTSVRK